ncbi:MAG: TetR/AcrR family transcriptional regulator C-terminal domain-containing protein, partial [Propionibacteriaceae bacterium]|nr:TetR/AcrR family transcriptional regulator C-terminal domain-containing protein [Propionibacteriaceae bacterium]
AIADEILAPPHVSRDLSSWAHELRAALLEHRDAAELVTSTNALGLGTVDPTAGGRELLAAAGHPEPGAAMATLLHFVLGHVVEEQTRAQMHALGVIDRFDAAASERGFALGVDIIVRGIGIIRSATVGG